MNKKYITDERGRKVAVVLNMGEFEAMMEDLEDLRKVAERKDEPSRTLTAVKDRLTKKWKSTKSSSKGQRRKN